MDKFIVTAEEIDIIIMLIKKNRRGFFYEFIEFDNVNYEFMDFMIPLGKRRVFIESIHVLDYFQALKKTDDSDSEVRLEFKDAPITAEFPDWIPSKDPP